MSIKRGFDLAIELARKLNIVTVTATYTATSTNDLIRGDATAANLVVNLPAAASLVGKTITVKKIDASANTVTIDPAGAETIDGAATKIIMVQYGLFQIVSNGVSWDDIT